MRIPFISEIISRNGVWLDPHIEYVLTGVPLPNKKEL